MAKNSETKLIKYEVVMKELIDNTCQNGDFKVLERLISKEALDINFGAKNYHYLLNKAVEYKSLEFTEFLFQCCVNVNAIITTDDNGTLSDMCKSHYNMDKFAKLIIKYSGDAETIHDY